MSSSFREWFAENLADEVQRYVQKGGRKYWWAEFKVPKEQCPQLQERYAAELWDIIAHHAKANGKTTLEWLVEDYRSEVVTEGYSGLQTLIVWLACDALAVEVAISEAA